MSSTDVLPAVIGRLGRSEDLADRMTTNRPLDGLARSHWVGGHRTDSVFPGFCGRQRDGVQTWEPCPRTDIGQSPDWNRRGLIMLPSSNSRRVTIAASLAMLLVAAPASARATPQENALEERCLDTSCPAAGTWTEAGAVYRALGAVRAVSIGVTCILSPAGQLGPASLGDPSGSLLGLSLSRSTPDSLGSRTSSSRPRSLYEATAALEDGDVVAIQRHLASVLERLEARDVSGLSATLRARRELLIERLSEYRERGIFPSHHGLPGIAPVFIDEEGRSCAVAFLMAESGSRELAGRVATMQNNAYVPEITTPGVLQWIEESGLDAEECALIQPSYGGCPIPASLGCIIGVAGPVRLEFFGNPRQGPGPLTVSFQGYYSRLHTMWSWDFGDGGTSSLQSPTHTYTAPGSYTVSLTAMSLFHPSSTTKTRVGYVVVLP